MDSGSVTSPRREFPWVYPVEGGNAGSGAVTLPNKAGDLAERLPPLSMNTTCRVVHETLVANATHEIYAVVDEGDLPIGLIDRTDFMGLYSQRFIPDLFHKKPITDLMSHQPLIVDESMPIVELDRLVAIERAEVLLSGFIVTENGRYLGIGTGQTLLRCRVERDARQTAELKKAVGEATRATQQLWQAQKMETIGQLTGGVAHDFNNLLAVIMGNLELLEKRGLNETTRERLLKPALNATHRGAELVRQLLAFSRGQALQPAPTFLGALLPNLRNIMDRTLGEAIAWEWSLSQDLVPCMVDPAKLEAAILNLAINARDAMPDGGRILMDARNVTVDENSAERFPDDLRYGRYVAIALSDSGHGMTPQVLARALEPFFTTKEEGKGSGLGLSMVYGFVKQSGGHMTIESELELGTTITLYLPQADEIEASSVLPPMPAGARCFSGTVLVVEDQPDVLETAIERFEDLGFNVLSAGTGQEALAILRSRTADIELLCTDVVLGNDMSGPEVVAEARRLRPDLKALFVSGYDSGMAKGKFKTNANERLLGKPYSEGALIEALTGLLMERIKMR